MPIKVAVVYTSTTPELIEMIDDCLTRELAGFEAELMNYRDPSILQEARDNGGVTPGCARRLLDLYEAGARDGAKVILNVCSSVGDDAWAFVDSEIEALLLGDNIRALAHFCNGFRCVTSSKIVVNAPGDMQDIMDAARRAMETE